MQCTGIAVRSGKRCKFESLEGKETCKHHTPTEEEVLEEVSSFFDNYSNSEIYTYVLNVTHGRIKLDQDMPNEVMAQRAEEYL